jgi:hypothetical protein
VRRVVIHEQDDIAVMYQAPEHVAGNADDFIVGGRSLWSITAK